MQVSGRFVVLSVFALAIAMSAGAWWYHYQATKQMVAFWGPAAASLLVRGELVDAYRLRRPAADGESDAADMPHWPPAFADRLERTAVAHDDLTGAPGLIHLRHALTQDDSYDWDAAAVDLAPTWEVAFRFSDGDDAVWVLLSEQLDYLGKAGADGRSIDVLPLQPKVGPVLRQYFDDVGLFGASGDSAE